MIWWKLVASSSRCRLNAARKNCHSSRRYRTTQFGICFDVDGVLVRGLVPLTEAVEAFRMLCHSSDGQLKVPTVFLTNSFSLNAYKAKLLSECLHVQISEDQVVQAHCPLRVFDSLKNKNCLVIGQGIVADIARQDLGMKNVYNIDELSEAYPLLDVVDHDKCRAAAKLPIVDSVNLPSIEAIVICGEPKHWETPLQLLIDLLLTSGRPSHDSIRSHHQTLPLIVCNPDLHYMGRSHIPRFGNGAFLVCLEALFKKVTGNELKYTAIVGKPSEISYRYAEHCLTEQSHRLFDNPSPLKTLYMIGDNREVDILGANLYKGFISGATVPASRTMPAEAKLHPQTVTSVVSILVSTGVHHSNSLIDLITAGESQENKDKTQCQSHRDFAYTDTDLFRPVVNVANVFDAVRYIMHRES